MTNRHSTPQARAEVYAKVLFDSSNSAGSVDAVVNSRNEFLEIINTLSNNVDARSILASNDVEFETKKMLISIICEGKSEAASAVFSSAVELGDSGLLKVVLRKLEDLISEDLKVCIVDVTSAVALDDHLRELIKDKAKRELGLDAILYEKVDPEILGGVIMSVNGKCIDASMITQLNRARSVLKAS